MKKNTITSLICIISVLGIIQNVFTQNPKEIHTFNLIVFLEGPYNGLEMNTTIFDDGLLPSNQPYNTEPWNYEGIETLDVNPGDDVVDWVLVEFIESPYGPESATPDRIIHTMAALLMADGSIVQEDGISLPEFDADIQHNLYVIIRHRNHLAVLSTNPLTELKGSFEYDFSDDLTKAYLNGQKEITMGVFGMASGDCDANGIIETADKDVCWTVEAGNMGYLPGDWNLDLQVNNPDKDDIWVTNMGLETKVPRPYECGDGLTDFRDDQTYNTIQHGNYCWMAENLNIGSRIDGNIDQSNNPTLEKYCYDNLESNCDTYGGLYQWNETMQYTTTPGSQGICPDNWNIPTTDEWNSLINSFGGSNSAGGKMKEPGYIHWSYPNSGATNESGFKALGGGYSDPTSFYNLQSNGYFYTSNESSSTEATTKSFSYNNSNVTNNYYDKSTGRSVRCINDNPFQNYPPNIPTDPSPTNNATFQPLDITFSWSCNDPENDPLTYELNFGSSFPLYVFATNLTDTFYLFDFTLPTNKTYYWQIKATDKYDNETTGPVWSFTTTSCGLPITDVRDGQIYNTVIIGDQCWMAENLNIGTMINSSANQTDNGDIEKYCNGNYGGMCINYGGLYQWNEMMQYTDTAGTQGICPDNWHLPTDEEWKQLEGFADSLYNFPEPEWDKMGYRGFNAGYNLKSTEDWTTPSVGSDLYGFSVLPSGGYFESGYFSWGNYGHFWTSTDSSSVSSWYRTLEDLSIKIIRGDSSKWNGFSVRCVKNIGPTSPSPNPPYDPSPENRSTDNPVNTILSWKCYDPFYEPLTFDVYFGAETDPPLVAEGISEALYDPGTISSGVTYKWKIIAHDDNGKSTAGPIWNFTTSFTCGVDQLLDLRDGKSYNTAAIGYQCWMAQNLDIGMKIMGTENQTNNGAYEKYCFANDDFFCITYGGLYQWNEALQYTTEPGNQGICPTGWHIPTDNEWKQLEGEVDGYYNYPDPIWNSTGYRGGNAGLNLKSTSGWTSGGNGTDLYGFTGLPGGNRSTDGIFNSFGEIGYFITSSINGSTESMFHMLHFNENGSGRQSYYKKNGFSLRCLKNNLPPEIPNTPNPLDGTNLHPTSTNLSWTCFDPDNDPLTFDVYFGSEESPTLIANGITDFTFDPGVLEPLNLYYWKIVAHDDHGHFSESDVWYFVTRECGDPFVDPRNGQTYNTVLMMNDCWMVENLNIGTRIDGINEQTDNETIEKYCYNNLESNCNALGGLYQWDEMMQYSTLPGIQGICPDGWHLPKDSRWKFIEGMADSQYGIGHAEWDSAGWRGLDAGINLKALRYDYWVWCNDNIGFKAIPGGMRDIYGNYNNLDEFLDYKAYFWSTDHTSDSAWSHELDQFHEESGRNSYPKENGFSVRCIKYRNFPPDPPSDPSPGNGTLYQSTNTMLSWTCSDPESDPLTFNVYFGTEPEPPLIVSGITDFNFDPGILDPGVNYYWKIVVKDYYHNYAESDIWSFQTLYCDTFSDPRDGQIYGTVLIDNQCWMAENLNIGTIIDGAGDQIDNDTIEKYCYNNLQSNCDTYGGLYQWNEMMQYTITQGAQGICPTGWYLPSDAEWCTLENEVDIGTVLCDVTGWRGTDAGNNLKESGTIHWSSPNTGATNSSGFTALPGGNRMIDGSFSDLSNNGTFWSSNENGSDAWQRNLNYDLAQVNRNVNDKVYGFSVRCLKTNQPPDVPSNPLPENGAIDVGIDTTLYWSCSEPDGDNLNYTIYFSLTNPPLLAKSGITDTLYDPGILEYDTTYYWKVIAYDTYGDSAVSNIWSFKTMHIYCGNEFTDIRDGQVYNTIQIGTQCWMVENLNIGTRIDGDENQTQNSPAEIIEKYCYDDLESNCDSYGGLYQWDEMIQYITTEGTQGICPYGWHLPTDEEWKQLEGEVDGIYGYPDPIWDNAGFRGSDAGLNLKSTNGWSGTGNGDDLYGFTGLPAGSCNPTSGDFNSLGEIGYFMTSTEYSSNAWSHVLHYNNHNDIGHFNYAKYYGLSVRCLKDE